MSDPNSQFNVVPAPNYGAPLLNFGGQQATKQPASTGTQAMQPAGQVNATAAQNLGNAIGKWMQQYNQKFQQMGGGQQAPPATWNLTPQQAQPQQQVGPPMNILPPGYGQ